ncbi:MAG: hypothetical protein A3C61_01850 [Candidatus Yanofskybacteria bacterium RIFCSPHIGHO2_02_FULL_39_10]|uniref:Uncharacterized protein n=1 Tax=Candidatus Yanofskybacteria bacterium RIFCSPHIGHO2_02_FULL_39_10 TaxID=1802674 RepID=A0A1F8F880_9BACT|nr:MAG: hypothetical protein A3C61_01850 [Candidatus Yanofskybacteria bacterium RIFCSPHIGHO2_02_FULL_39_10]
MGLVLVVFLFGYFIFFVGLSLIVTALVFFLHDLMGLALLALGSFFIYFSLTVVPKFIHSAK